MFQLSFNCLKCLVLLQFLLVSVFVLVLYLVFLEDRSKRQETHKNPIHTNCRSNPHQMLIIHFTKCSSTKLKILALCFCFILALTFFWKSSFYFYFSWIKCFFTCSLSENVFYKSYLNIFLFMLMFLSGPQKHILLLKMYSCINKLTLKLKWCTQLQRICTSQQRLVYNHLFCF